MGDDERLCWVEGSSATPSPHQSAGIEIAAGTEIARFPNSPMAVGNASFALGPSYTIEELLDGHWTLPVRSRTFSGGYGSCSRTYRITTSVG